MTAKNTGRATGTVPLVQLVGLILPFVLRLPLGRDFITSAAPAAVQIRLAINGLAGVAFPALAL